MNLSEEAALRLADCDFTDPALLEKPNAFYLALRRELLTWYEGILIAARDGAKVTTLEPKRGQRIAEPFHSPLHRPAPKPWAGPGRPRASVGPP